MNATRMLLFADLAGLVMAASWLVGCSSSSSAGAPANGGASSGGAAGASHSGTGASSTGGRSTSTTISVELPPAPGASNQPAPSANVSAPNLKILSWAGFKSAVSYTLDDSQPSQIEHWPELKATGVHMTFYANPSQNWFDGYDATWKDAIARGCEIGNHTMNHCDSNLQNCKNPLGSIAAEIDQCTDYIKNTLGEAEVSTMAYPYGDTGYSSYAQARFFLGRGTNNGMIAPLDDTDAFDLPVVAAQGGEDASVFSGSIDEARGQGQWVLFLFHSIMPTQNNWTAGVDISSITGSIDHGKQLGDVWIDSAVNVGAYWVGQKVVQSVTPKSGATYTWTWNLPAHFPTGHGLRVTVDGGTLSQGSKALTWDGHGYYEVALDGGALSWKPRGT